MKKIIVLAVVVMPVLALAQSSSAENEFNPKAGFSVFGGLQYHKHNNAAAPVYGFEFSMECPLDPGKKNHIRQKISIARQDSKDYQSLSIEINPQYRITGTPSFEWGIGPVAGIMITRVTESNKPVFIYGLGAGAVYYFNKMFIGIESRYGLTKKVALDKINNGSEIIETTSLDNSYRESKRYRNDKSNSILNKLYTKVGIKKGPDFIRTFF